MTTTIQCAIAMHLETTTDTTKSIQQRHIQTVPKATCKQASFISTCINSGWIFERPERHGEGYERGTPSLSD